MMEAAAGAGEKGGEDEEARAQRRVLSRSRRHVLQKQLCMHAESQTCPELVKGVDTRTAT